jgi:nicotinate-nucleotide adenylyltransferase
MDKQRYGILGGTFDPIHIGHLIAAQSSQEALNLDRVLFLPSAHPPHKRTASVSPYDIRRKMVELAIQGNPLFELSDLEAQRPDTSYTIRTLKDLRRDYPPEAFDLFLLIGGDSLVEFDTWRDPEAIFAEIAVAVFARPGYDVSAAPEIFRQKAQWISMPLIDISSSGIRERVASNRSIRYMVPEKVEEFIYKNGLYKPQALRSSDKRAIRH